MTQFVIHPSIWQYDTCQAFAQDFHLGPQDLLLTNEFLYTPYFAPLNLPCPVLFQEKYGLGEPSDEMVEAIYRDMPKEVTRVIAVGGGGVLDIAKLLVLQHVTPILDLYDGKLPLQKARDLVLVPTTCGTGSEVTNISILALLSRRTKKGLAHESMFADQAVLIPELLKGLPFSVFATSSIDALIHAIESSLSPKASATTKLFGYQAIAWILKGYLAIRDQGPDARFPLLSQFLLASNYAGIAFGNAGCAAVHALSYPLGGKYHIAHGVSNAILLVPVMKFNEPAIRGKLAAAYDRVVHGEKTCTTEEEKSAWVVNRMGEIVRHLDIPTSLTEFNVPVEDLDGLVKAGMQVTRLLVNNMRVVTPEDARAIYSQILH